MHRWKQQQSPNCPRCANTVEDAGHIWVCRGDGVDATWETSIRTLRQWMIQQKTLPNLVMVICDRLSAWRNNSRPTIMVSSFLGLRSTVQSQEDVGWRSLLEGLPVRGWAEVQQRYYEFIGSRKTGERWLTALIQKLWDVAWDLWDHRNSVVHDKDSNQRLR